MEFKDNIAAATRESRGLLEPEAYELLKEYDIPVPEYRIAANESDLIPACEVVGYPVVLKVISPRIIHKSDANAVIVDVKSERDASTGYRRLVTAMKGLDKNLDLRGILVSKMMPEGREVIIGMTRDPQFGPAVIFGLGGIFVEVLKDVAYRVAPVSDNEAADMIREIKGYPLLAGVRGSSPSDIEALISIIRKISNISQECPEIAELDLNPVFVYENGACAVDARILLRPSEGSA